MQRKRLPRFYVRPCAELGTTTGEQQTWDVWDRERNIVVASHDTRKQARGEASERIAGIAEQPAEENGQPVMVHVPLVGRWRILVWWTEWERHHVVLSRSNSGLLAAAKRIVVRYRDGVKFKRAVVVEMASPGPTFRAAVAKVIHGERVKAFLVELLCAVSKLRDAGEPLPYPFAVCKARVGKGDPRHYACDKCIGGIHTTVSPEHLYEMLYSRWRATCGASNRGFAFESKLAPVRAPEAPDGERLLAAVDDGGHHQQGIVFCEASPEQAAHGKILFYYREVEPLDVEPFQRLADEAKAAEKLIADKARAMALAHVAAEERAELERIRAFFAAST